MKALPWYEQVAEKLADERYSGFFLPFRDGIYGTYTSPPCSHGLCSPSITHKTRFLRMPTLPTAAVALGCPVASTYSITGE